MVKAKNTKNTSRSESQTKNSKRTTKQVPTETINYNVVDGIGHKELFGFIAGFLITCVAIFMLISFCSYIYTGDYDFDKLENTTAADWENENYSFHNICGVLGAKIAYFFIHCCFGLSSFIIIPYLVILGMRMMRIYRVTLIKKFIIGSILLIWTSVLLSSINFFIPGLEDTFINLGGNHGKYVVKRLTALAGIPGLFTCLFVTAVLYLIYISAETINYIRSILRLNFIKKIKIKRQNAENADAETDSVEEDETDDESEDTESDALQNSPVIDEVAKAKNTDETENDVYTTGDSNTGVENQLVFDITQEDIQKADKTKIDAAEGLTALIGKQEQKDKKDKTADSNSEKGVGFDVSSQKTERGNGDIKRGEIGTPYDPKLDLEYYKYPPLSLLDQVGNNSPMVDMAEQTANKDRITQVLHNFGVDITSIKATIGPTITLYEIIPVEGTRISKIRNLEDDIALSLAAKGIRIIAPIPGKGTIGIEVPNKNSCIVSMESILSSKAYQESTMELPCAVGKTITNDVFMFDLAKAPHLLVAGATGQGKSVGLNAIITSLLYKKHPAELKIVMVDPKKVEFSIYSPIENHFLARLEEEEDCIITDVQKVVKTLNSLCQLMDTRYDMLKKAGVRNIKEYNAKFKERKLNPENGHEFMPYVVVVVDEFGDLIMTAGKEVELPICRIAQLARAVGIHMIIATQRPQASIISGAIKTNFPARMAFKVSSMIDSRVVLDRPGAQQLIGRGDMLFLAGAEPVRVQCAFVDTPEVSDICQYIAKQQSYLHPLYLPEVLIENEDAGGGMGNFDPKRLDPMFPEVAKFVVNQQNGSTSFIQRNYSIGYNRAGKIMDQLEKMGVVGPQVGAKPREVLIKDPLTLEGLLNSIG